MPITAIVPTSHLNTIKVTLESILSQDGSYTRQQRAEAPEVIQQILAIEGINAIHIEDNIITLDRDPNLDWDTILDDLKGVVGK